MKAYWFTDHEQGGFPVERAALGSCELSVLHIGGEWQWLVRHDGRDVAEGVAPSADDAKREAEAMALRLLDPPREVSENRASTPALAVIRLQVKRGRPTRS